MEVAVGSLVFTGTQAGIVLGYTDGKDADGNPERQAIIARFGASDTVPVAELGTQPTSTEDPAAGAVVAEPTHDGGDTSTTSTTLPGATTPSSATGGTVNVPDASAAPVSEADVQTAPTTAEIAGLSENEAAQNAEIARLQDELATLRASQQAAPSEPGAGPEGPAPSAPAQG